MNKPIETPCDLISRISKVTYDCSHRRLKANGWCLSSDGEMPELIAAFEKQKIEQAEFHTGLPRPDVLEKHPNFDSPNCGWEMVAEDVDIPPGSDTLSVTARSSAGAERAMLEIERFDGDPFAPVLHHHRPEALDRLSFSVIRGLYPLQRYVHSFGENIVNTFDIDAWNQATCLRHIGVRLIVREGAVSVSLRHVGRDERVTELVALAQNGKGTQLSGPIRIADFDGALVPLVTYASEGANFDIVFATDDPPQTPHARINYIFCTFKRAEYVQHNANVFRDYMRRHKAQHAAHLTVIDNGSQDGENDCGVKPDENVSVFPNNNTGGAGGFGRGIYESCYGALTAENFTHVCLLDDDIYLEPEMFARNTAFTRFLKPGFHVGAPMYPTTSPDHAPRRSDCFGHKFRGTVHPSDKALGARLDTRDVHGFIKMDRSPDTTGWWWDCIAVSDIHRIGLPYPFFIKMDDVEYGLRLRDAGVKLVIPFSFWVLHEDFEEKYSAAMQYFRFRNRWLLLALKGRLEDIDVFIDHYTSLVRNFIAQRKYEHAQLLLNAMTHLLKGPEYLVQNEKSILSGIFSTVKNEKNVTMPEPPDGAEVVNGLPNPASPRTERLNRITVNNHFLPLKERVAIDTTQPHHPMDCRRGKVVSWWNAHKGVGYTVTRDSKRALRQTMQLRRIRRRMSTLPKVIAKYQRAKQHLTAQAFWATYGKFGETPRLAADQAETVALHDLRNEVARLHSEVQKQGTLSDQQMRDVSLADESALNALRNRYLGQRCFVLGNGPSLTIADLELLRDEVTFAANKIYLAFNETNWRPTFYSVEDLLVAKNNTSEILSVEGCTKIFPSHMLPLLPRQANHIYTRWLPPADNQSPFREFSTDLVKGVCWGSTITYSMLQMAVHMGFREIHILGLDHSYVEPATKKDGALVSEGERNHFHPDYRKPGEKWHYPVLDRLENSYRFAKAYCDSIGVSVYNTSRFSKLEAFPRADLDEVLGRKSTARGTGLQADSGKASEPIDRKPSTLAAPRNGKPDDLKKIKGIGATLEKLCHDLGVFHFDQIAGWSDEEVAWVDVNLSGFKGRVSRDHWVTQAKSLAIQADKSSAGS